MPITDMQPAEKVWGNFGCIRIDCRTLCLARYFFSMLIIIHSFDVDYTYALTMNAMIHSSAESFIPRLFTKLIRFSST